LKQGKIRLVFSVLELWD